MSREVLSAILVSGGFSVIGEIAWMSGNTTIILDMEWLTIVHNGNMVSFPFNENRSFRVKVANGRLSILGETIRYSQEI